MAAVLRLRALRVGAIRSQTGNAVALDTYITDFVATRDRTIEGLDCTRERFSIKDAYFHDKMSDLSPRVRYSIGVVYRTHLIGQIHSRTAVYTDSPVGDEVCIN
jgi:hypothetical protein